MGWAYLRGRGVGRYTRQGESGVGTSEDIPVGGTRVYPSQPPLDMGQGIPTPSADTYWQPSQHVWLTSKQYTSYWNAFVFPLFIT